MGLADFVLCDLEELRVKLGEGGEERSLGKLGSTIDVIWRDNSFLFCIYKGPGTLDEANK